MAEPSEVPATDGMSVAAVCEKPQARAYAGGYETRQAPPVPGALTPEGRPAAPDLAAKHEIGGSVEPILTPPSDSSPSARPLTTRGTGVTLSDEVAQPYYADDHVTLYCGDCREITAWLAADVLVTDPPYGRAWRQGRLKAAHQADDSHDGIAGDLDTTVRDWALAAWGERLAVVFGDLMLAPPPGTKQVNIYRKPPNAGTRGAMGGWRRDAEAIYLLGPWPTGLGGRSSIIATSTPSQGNPSSPQGRYGHPHAKPLDVLEQVIAELPPGTIADPFAGSGSTLVAARNLGRKAIGVEIEEGYCEVIAKRLSQMAFDFGDAS